MSVVSLGRFGTFALAVFLGLIPQAARAFPTADFENFAEGSLGGVHGLIAQGALPENSPVLDQAKESFVDGLSLAATVAAVVVALAALAVKRFLPSDRPRPEVAADAATVTEASAVVGD